MSDKAKQTKLVSPVRSIRTSINRNSQAAIDLARAVWKLAEPPMKEFKSADLLQQYLCDAGFKADRPWAVLPTAFRASIGKGGPKIAFLAEYDALPDCGVKWKVATPG